MNNPDILDFFIDTMQREGMSVVSVKDGKVFYFKKSVLQDLIDKCDKNNSETAMIFVKDRVFKD